jgi:hypothetical protein
VRARDFWQMLISALVTGVLTASTHGEELRLVPTDSLFARRWAA